MSLPIPAEWAPHDSFWIGFPSDPHLWEDDLEPAQEEVADLVRALAGPGREQVKLLIDGDAAMAAAKALLVGVAGVTLVPGKFGDIWLRDTGPIFARTKDGGLIAHGFRFNGWGGKYDLPFDDVVAAQLSQAEGAPLLAHDFVLEGGAVDHDGEGTVLTTRQCLLNPNRNPGWDAGAVEAALKTALGAGKVIWLGDGLLNDHTDGHVDNLARFIAPSVACCPIAFGDDDPNAEVFEAVAADLAAAHDAQGRPLKVVRLPSPGLILDADGEAVPASHMNFIIANGAVIAPVYGEDSAEALHPALAQAFPRHEIILLPANAVLTGGGSFHCISQQVPSR